MVEMNKEQFLLFNNQNRAIILQLIAQGIIKYTGEVNNKVENKEEIKFVKCNKCDNGFIRYFKEIKDGERTLKYSYVALCNCENGKKQKEINGYNLPFITEVGL